MHWSDKSRRFGLLTAVLALAAALVGCDQAKISEINRHPETYAGYEVTIVGQVTASGGDFSSGTFEVDDGSGRLWVVSNKLALPAQGSRIVVTGMVESRTQLGSTGLPTVLQEISRYEGGS